MLWNQLALAEGEGRRQRMPEWRPSVRRSPERRNVESRQLLIERVRAEFDAFRGLKLTLAQARRLFGVREDVCVRVLDALVEEGLLTMTPDNLFARRIDG